MYDLKLGPAVWPGFAKIYACSRVVYADHVNLQLGSPTIILSSNNPLYRPISVLLHPTPIFSSDITRNGLVTVVLHRYDNAKPSLHPDLSHGDPLPSTPSVIFILGSSILD